MTNILPLMPATVAIFRLSDLSHYSESFERMRTKLTESLKNNQTLPTWPESGMSKENGTQTIGFSHTFLSSGANFRTTLTMNTEVSIRDGEEGVLFYERQEASFDTYRAKTPQVTPATTTTSFHAKLLQPVPQSLAEAAVGRPLGQLVGLPPEFSEVETYIISSIEGQRVMLEHGDFTAMATHIHQEIQDQIKRF